MTPGSSNGSALLPIAHAGHYLWTLYLVPFIVVVVSIIRSVLEQRREKRERRR